VLDVLIITRNEESNLPHCLAALQGWTRRIYVVDSGSTDRTPEIAREMGAEFVHHDWPGYAAQKNWALENLDFSAPWTLIVDADEVITPALRAEIEAVCGRDPETVEEMGFYLNRRLIFMDRPIRHCGYFPSWNLRLFKRGSAVYESREVHEHMLVDGQTGYLDAPMEHWDRRGLGYYVAKHNEYSTLEAKALTNDLRADSSRIKASLFGNALERRRWMKLRVYPWLPMPWVFRFLYMFVLRLGFLDGFHGLRFCLFIASYEMLVKLKLIELRRQGDAVTVGSLPDADHLSGRIETTTAAALVSEDALVAPSPSTTVQPDAETEVRPDPAPAPAVHAGMVAAKAARTGAFSVVILTLDEEINIRACIESLEGIGDIHVLDSGSTDATCNIAREMGAEVSVNPFESFGKQRNWAIDNMPLRHEWVLHLDADERMTPELRAEIEAVIAGNPREAGFFVPSKLMFMGRWLKHAGGYPTYQVRLFHSSRLRFTDYGHGQREDTEGEVGTLNEPYLHDAFSKGLDDWLAKHNRYSRQEAEQAIAEKAEGIRFGDLFSSDAITRRRMLKRIAYRLPARASLRWWFIYLGQLGFLEGREARTYATLITTYERMTGIKIKWLESQARARS
jgi:glycosyltransferase involved in cell wall biosynthesis